MRQQLISIPASLNALIRERRKEKGMTQVMLAEEACVRPATISSLENNVEKSSVGLLLRILAILDVEIHATERYATLEKENWPEKW